MKVFSILALALGIFWVMGCSGKSATSAQQLMGNQWKLIKMHKGSVEIPVAQDQNEQGAFVHFTADQGAFNGNAGCNGFFGSYTISEAGEMRFSGVGMTRRMCDPQSMAIEDTLVQLFADTAVVMASVKDNELTLKSNDIQAVFMAE